MRVRALFPRACDLTYETTPAEPAPAQPGSGDPSRPGAAGLTRAEWRRLAAEAELAAKVAEPQTSTSIAEVDADDQPAIPSARTPLATEIADAVIDADFDETAVTDAPRPVSALRPAGARPDDDVVLTVVDGDAHAGIEFFDGADEAPLAERRHHIADDATAHLPGESFGPAAVDDAALPGAGANVDEIPMPAPLPDDRVVDEFEFASRLFSFTAQTPVQVAAEAIAEQEAVEASAAAPGRTGRVVKRLAAASFSVGAMAAVGLLAVGLTSPAAVLASGDSSRDISVDASAAASSSAKIDDEQIQAYVSSSQQGVTFDRSETFDVTSASEIAADSGVTIFAGTWVNDPNAAIQWPFPVGVPISAAFGSSSYLSQFSTPHRGVDLTPGVGADIHAVAGGTVRIATESGGDYGVTVVIDHVIDGELISTRYGHMQYDSLQVEVGDTVTPGQVIGNVGSTGRSTGAHLHLEVLLGGTTQTDPIAWLEEHTKR